MTRRQVRRFTVHVPGRGTAGEHTLDELLDAYPETTWTFDRNSDDSGVVITISHVGVRVAWAVERPRRVPVA